MALYITGDVHGGLDKEKLSPELFPQGATLTKDDYVIVTGDFGYIWSGITHSLFEKRRLLRISKRNWTALFIDGNHENHARLATLPTQTMFGAPVGQAEHDIFHLRRGYVYDIDGLRIFAMGGANSAPCDKAQRIEGKTWWSTEVPTPEQRERALANLDACGWKVDVVITHEGPSGLVSDNPYFRHTHAEDEYTDWLADVADRLEFGSWYFGHHHIDTTFTDTRFRCLFDDVVDAHTGVSCTERREV